MAKLWQGRTAGTIDQAADDFNASIHFDCRMIEQDIKGSVAHAAMLGKQGILSPADAALLVETLGALLSEYQSGTLTVDMSCEDIHTFIEQELTKRIGAVGKKLHTARSRNDQVALDLRLYLRDKVNGLLTQVAALMAVLCNQAEAHKSDIMPGYTHLQRAQPITFGHHLMAYAMMLQRDYGRLTDAVARMNVSPLGSCALAGTTFATDRAYAAGLLGFDGISENSLDGVSDRDFCVELQAAFSILMMHLSRFSEEVILWASWEFHFITLDDAYTTGSSIMPQKKNADMAELVRGKTGRVYGNLMATLTMLKGLPLAYNKDMQEDKEGIFDSLDTLTMCLTVFTPMIATMTVNKDEMYKAAQKGFINATDLADYLTKKGMPFREAYQLIGALVGQCVAEHKTLEDISLSEYQEKSSLFSADLYDAISLETCVSKRISAGGTSVPSVEKQIALTRQFLTEIVQKKKTEKADAANV